MVIKQSGYVSRGAPGEGAPPASQEQLDAVFGALADATRRGILQQLAGGACTVKELAAPFAMSQPAISKHLKVLEQAGLVVRSVDGPRRPAALQGSELAAAAAWLEQIHAFWMASFDELEVLLAEMQSEKQNKEN